MITPDFHILTASRSWGAEGGTPPSPDHDSEHSSQHSSNDSSSLSPERQARRPLVPEKPIITITAETPQKYVQLFTVLVHYE